MEDLFLLDPILIAVRSYSYSDFSYTVLRLIHVRILISSLCLFRSPVGFYKTYTYTEVLKLRIDI